MTNISNALTAAKADDRTTNYEEATATGTCTQQQAWMDQAMMHGIEQKAAAGAKERMLGQAGFSNEALLSEKAALNIDVNLFILEDEEDSSRNSDYGKRSDR